jgi:para-aminobenzoate synthetase / 4-amino-4-deoxychorismate lyase
MTSPLLHSGSVLLLDCLKGKHARLFSRPRDILACRDLKSVDATLEAVEEARRAGFHVAGFLAYELGYAFEEKLRHLWAGNGDLLAWFGIYDEQVHLGLEEAKALLGEAADEKTGVLETPVFDWPEEGYGAAFDQVQDHLARGDVYQVNLTLRARFRHTGSSAAVFLKLLERQPVAHAAYLQLDDRAILSLSPELFLERQGKTLRTRPMKGTAPRGRTVGEDIRIARQLANDPKQRAENTMIVDLMRNDLSRIAETGSVEVTGLCDVERYKSLHQMTSTVEAELLPDLGFPEIIKNLFPCGSITGAPKLSAMTIADRLETSPRGVYTGSIGHVEPSGDFSFNVAIRTLVLRDDGTGEVGTGSGVVHDSGNTAEYDECGLKLKFMTAETSAFSLIETMAYVPGDGYLLFERHLKRLAASAAYFGFEYNDAALRDKLEGLSAGFSEPVRVRLVLEENGCCSVTQEPLSSASDGVIWSVAVAGDTCRSDDRFLYHKTTNRAFYDQTRTAYAARTGCQEVLFENENGFLTEGSFTSLFLLKDGKLLTPALHHGLLPGTLRAALLERGTAVEADLIRSDLMAAEKVYVGNSVRGLVQAELLETPAVSGAHSALA